MGIVASALFSVSFVLNRQMSLSSGHWAWSASLRFLMMLSALAGVITFRRQWRGLFALWRCSPWGWIVWGTLGSSVYYGALTAACAVSPAWVVAATWPVSIVIGVMLGPFIYRGDRRKIPRRALVFSVVILAGIGLLQIGELQAGIVGNIVLGLLLVLISATAHPIGNRKSMMIFERAGESPDAILRLTLYIIGALPSLFMLCAWGLVSSGLPDAGQVSLVAIVAATGLVASPLFFAATDRVNRNPSSLAAVEATQAVEIVATLILEASLLGVAAPGIWAWAGLAMIVAGILLHALPETRR